MKNALILLVMAVIITLKATSQVAGHDSSSHYHSMTIEVSGLPFTTSFISDLGLEFQNNKHSFIYAVEYIQGIGNSNLYPDFEFGIMDTYRKYFRSPNKNFQPFAQASLFLFYYKSMGFNYDYKDWLLYGGTLFIGIGVNYNVSHRLSVGISCDMGDGIGCGKRTFENDPNYKRFHITPPPPTIRLEEFASGRAYFSIGYHW